MKQNMRQPCRALCLIFSLILLQLSATKAYAIAYCAIREPVSIIQEFFPAYTSYKTLEGNIDESVRQEIKQVLPDSHFQEFGIHSLYVVYREEVLIGYVHARTEKGLFGLDEIIWVMDADMKLKNFKYQKNRSGTISQSMTQKLIRILAGLDLMGVANALQTEPDLNQRDRLIISSAVKALFVTTALWPRVQNLQKVQDLGDSTE
jgi:hypothetical protein